MTLEEVRARHPEWSIQPSGLEGIMCQYGAFRFRALDPDDVHEEIVKREQPWALGLDRDGPALRTRIDGIDNPGHIP